MAGIPSLRAFQERARRGRTRGARHAIATDLARKRWLRSLAEARLMSVVVALAATIKEECRIPKSEEPFQVPGARDAAAIRLTDRTREASGSSSATTGSFAAGSRADGNGAVRKRRTSVRGAPAWRWRWCCRSWREHAGVWRHMPWSGGACRNGAVAKRQGAVR